jgi:thioredoxin-dependent peroxiredoxin
MSKKTRKKSSKPSTGKAIRAQSATSAKKAPSKTRGATATKSSTNIKNRQTGKATAKASHKAPLKKLKSPGPAESAPRATSAPKAAAAKPAVAKPALAKPAIAKSAVAKPPVAKPTAAKPTAAKPAVVDSQLKKPSAETAGESAASGPAPAVTTSGHSSVSLAEGSKAPTFSLPRDGGSTVSLRDYAGQKLVLFFYPRADTPGCTKEAIDFTRLADAFADAQTVVLGVSADPLKAQEAFRNKHELSTPLVSDEQHEMLEAYGVWGEKSMYGRTFLGVLRTTVLIGKDGRIIRIWRHVKVDGHADEVLAAAQAG